ncbi:MAG: transcription antitermination factor NusB [Acidobacteriaceae bacterium]
MQKTAPTAPAPTAPITPARSAAFTILLRIATTSAHSDDLLHGPALNALSQPDRNLATTLVLGVLRWQIALDARIQPLLQRPDQPLPEPVAIALRLGAFQLLHLDRIPAHAALSESVELVRAAGHPHAAGMVNAILRNLTRQTPTKPKLYETTAAMAERLGHPLWLVNRWVQNYGRSAAEAICTYGQQEPHPGSLFPGEDNLPHLDDGSRLVAELAAAAHPVAARIWDTCAAPGGKTLILQHRHSTAHILATDANSRRLQSLTTRLETAAPRVRTLLSDAAQLPTTEGAFDLILCDVPCSGTGTLGRNPELRNRLQPSDLPCQATRQREILIAALTHLAPGGNLLYSTCSLEPEENEQVVAAALAASSGITAISLEPTLNRLLDNSILPTPAPASLLREGNLRTLPGANFQGDGFFAALLHRPL